MYIGFSQLCPIMSGNKFIQKEDINIEISAIFEI